MQRDRLPVFWPPKGFNFDEECHQINYQEYMQSLDRLKNMGENAAPNTPLKTFSSLLKKNETSDSILLLCSLEDPIIEQNREPINAKPTIDERNIGKPVISIFIDHSNIAAGLVADGKCFIDPEQLDSHLKLSRQCAQKQIFGTFPSAEDNIWTKWKELGYKVKVGRAGKEVFVDDSIHAQIFRLILSQSKYEVKDTIVLVTGDGNKNENYSSFVECVMRALENGHQVEICSWKNRLNKIYLGFCRDDNQPFKIRYLDEVKADIIGNNIFRDF